MKTNEISAGGYSYIPGVLQYSAANNVGVAVVERLLKALRIIELRLEGDDQADRTDVVSRLVSLAGDPARAVAVWRRLRELSDEYAQTAATVTYKMLVRDVSTVVQIAAPSPVYAMPKILVPPTSTPATAGRRARPPRAGRRS